MKNAIIILLSVIYLSLGFSCKKKETTEPTPKNYFTCKINGVGYKPSEYNGTSNYSIDIDPNYRDGIIAIVTYSYLGNSRNYTVGIGSDSLKGVGRYEINKYGRHRMIITNHINNCEYSSDGQDIVTSFGYFTFDQYDLNNFIFSGEFEATMIKTDGCDTLHITEGKFYYHQ